MSLKIRTLDGKISPKKNHDLFHNYKDPTILSKSTFFYRKTHDLIGLVQFKSYYFIF